MYILYKSKMIDLNIFPNTVYTRRVNFYGCDSKFYSCSVCFTAVVTVVLLGTLSTRLQIRSAVLNELSRVTLDQRGAVSPRARKAATRLLKKKWPIVVMLLRREKQIKTAFKVQSTAKDSEKNVRRVLGPLNRQQSPYLITSVNACDNEELGASCGAAFNNSPLQGKPSTGEIEIIVS
ncbi:hypothetical protein JOB18_037252 [Solea senegalensis]|uniref:Uncharacterized protein n=1 Tax=Solea senegalensis TaxID=28829 RepID=A0AAV6SJJ8_SOLSE|nr:hypothetical protein JOB18_037252 [Solea senegalensis]